MTNPAEALAQLIAALKDADEPRAGHPAPFYDKVRPLSEEERELLARLPFDEKQWLEEAGESGAADGERGFSTLERT